MAFKNPWGKGSKEHDKWFKNDWANDGKFTDKLFNRDENDDDAFDSEIATTKKMALAFWGGAKKTGDNGAFKYAAINTQKSYGAVYENKKLFAKTGKFIVDTVNEQEDDGIGRLDILTHASASACYMVRNKETKESGELKNIPIEPNDMREANYLFASSTASSIETTLEWNIPDGNETATIYDFKFSKFADDSVVEFHGCMVATAAGLGIYDNLAENISEALYDEGKKNAVAIGHGTKANPNIDGSETTIKGQDYRHGKRIIYHNGTILFSTNKSGHIGKDTIKKYLTKKENDTNYDGTKETD